MINKLSLKQRKFWKCYCETHSLIKAAKYAGSNGKDAASLSTIGYEILRSLELSMPELLDAQGLTNEKCNKVLADGLQANHVVIATYKGKIEDERAYIDYPTRAKYLEIFHRLRGQFIDKHELTGKDGGDISLVVSAPSKGKGKKTISFED